MNKEYSEILNQRIAFNSEKKLHTSIIRGNQYTVFEDVYTPDSSTFGSSAQFYCTIIPKMGGTLIQVGTGCGIISIDSLLNQKFDKAIGLDIFDKAVQCARFNATSLGVQGKANFLVSNVLDAVSEQTKADLICWHYPFNAIPQGKIEQQCSSLELAYFDPGLKSLKKYLQARKTHVKQNGRMFLSMSPTGSPVSQMNKLFQQLNLQTKQIARKDFGYQVVVVEINVKK